MKGHMGLLGAMLMASMLQQQARYSNNLHGRRRARFGGIENERAREAGIPKWLRQHAKRYGVSVDEIIATHKQFPTETLNEFNRRKRFGAKA